MSNDKRTIGAGYFDRVLLKPGECIANAQRELSNIEFDTIVCTGLSGVTFGSLLAYEEHCALWLVRKADDKSTHSSAKIEGIKYVNHRARVLVVDDFTSTGNTMMHIRKTLTEAGQYYTGAYEIVGEYMYRINQFTPEGEQDWLDTYSTNEIDEYVMKKNTSITEIEF